MVKLILGIDPGNNGAIVAMRQNLIDPLVWTIERVFRLERGEDSIADFFRDIKYPGPYVAYMEKVTGFGGGIGLKLRENYGFLRGSIKARQDMRLVDVRPQEWMKAMGVSVLKGALHRQDMRRLAEEVQNEITPTNWNAAAILIAHYGLRLETGRGLHEQ